MPQAPKRKLLVEGDEDKRVIPELVEQNGMSWGRKENPLVTIVVRDGLENLLQAKSIETHFKAAELEALGILVDANDDCDRRWSRIKNSCGNIAPVLPETIPVDGLVVENEDGKRLGVWIMPDNHSSGMIETFLDRLISDELRGLRDFARRCRDESRQHGAPWKDIHDDKALVHAWLAWQDPPGSQLHTAIIKHQLQPQSESAASFLSWFRKLYRL